MPIDNVDRYVDCSENAHPTITDTCITNITFLAENLILKQFCWGFFFLFTKNALSLTYSQNDEKANFTLSSGREGSSSEKGRTF